jgi:hypothetical protein
MKNETKPAKRAINWDAIEPDWRAGIKSKQQIGLEHDVSRAALTKHFDKADIQRNLRTKIQAAADALVSCSAVPPQVSPPTSRTTDETIIAANAQSQAAIRLGHRLDIARGRAFFSELMDALKKPDGEGKMPTLVIFAEVGKKAIDVLDKVIRLEREAHGIDKEATESPIDTALKQIAERKRNAVQFAH